MTDPPLIDEPTRERMRQCLYSSINCSFRSMMPDYKCNIKGHGKLCRLYWGECKVWEQFPTHFNT